MALTLQAFQLLASRLPGKRVLSLGYPDLLVTPEDIFSLLGVQVTRFTEFGRWHGITRPVPETEHVFEQIGATLECVDVRPSRGVERVVDLNLPCELGPYDVVIDPGTVEHCFNVGQALMNAANAVAVGGCIFHSPPLTMVNHGFYNISPTLFNDFYKQNDWEIEMLVGATKEGCFDVRPVARFSAPSEAYLYCIARRRTQAALRVPLQSKYVKHPSLSSRA